jgi:hypothetical protein
MFEITDIFKSFEAQSEQSIHDYILRVPTMKDLTSIRIDEDTNVMVSLLLGHSDGATIEWFENLNPLCLGRRHNLPVDRKR